MDSIGTINFNDECSQCVHHTQGKLDDTCRRCLDATDHGQGHLINFSPIDEDIVNDAEKACSNCLYADTHAHMEPCRDCTHHDEWEPQDIGIPVVEEILNATPDHAVYSPSHYMLFPDGTEAIDIIRASLTEEEFRGYCKGNCLKYRLRAGKKDSLEQDISKADNYVGMMDGC